MPKLSRYRNWTTYPYFWKNCISASNLLCLTKCHQELVCKTSVYIYLTDH